MAMAMAMNIQTANSIFYEALQIKIDQGDTEAMKEMGCYRHEYDNEDSDILDEYFFMAFEHGDKNALYELAVHYMDTDNDNKVEKYLLMSMEKGSNYKESINQLAALYYYNIKDYDKAKKYIDLALNIYDATTDENYILLNAGDYYEEIEHDYEKAKQYYMMAINDNNMENLIPLGRLYQYKIKDYDEMLKCYQKLIDGKFYAETTAMMELGLYYQSINDYDNMKKYWLMGIDKGNTNCMYYLGLYYRCQALNPLNPDNSDYDMMVKKYLIMAAEHKHTRAMYKLGRYYEYLEDFDNMKKYHQMACDHWDPYAKSMFEIGFHYMLEKNTEMMIKYYTMAAEHGYELAIQHLSVYYGNNKKLIPLIKIYNNKLNNRDNLLRELCAFMSNNDQEPDEEIIEIILNLSKTDLEKCSVSIRLLNNLLKQNLDMMGLHFKYSMEGKGFKEAKTDFIKQTIGKKQD
jgi:uncharacterized protein